MWARDQQIRYATPGNMVYKGAGYAYAGGYLPELDPLNKISEIDRLIAEAIVREPDERWRKLLDQGLTELARTEIYESWLEKRGEATRNVLK